MTTKKLTAATITDDQIRDFNDSATTLEHKVLAMAALRVVTTKPERIKRSEFRARVAEILNARRVCRACEGDGIVEADSFTAPNERVTRNSRRCPYCRGKGWVSK